MITAHSLMPTLVHWVSNLRLRDCKRSALTNSARWKFSEFSTRIQEHRLAPKICWYDSWPALRQRTLNVKYGCCLVSSQDFVTSCIYNEWGLSLFKKENVVDSCHVIKLYEKIERMKLIFKIERRLKLISSNRLSSTLYTYTVKEYVA